MSKDSDQTFAQDSRGNPGSQREVPGWKEQTFNTHGEITTVDIQEQRKTLPIYKLRDSLLQAIGDVSETFLHICAY